MSASTSSRWCPTPEQLMILEELFRSGIRTPHASQIQRITAHLSLYGKIQGKNVFYWFQNHKARDRQKLRRKLIKQLQQQQLNYHHLRHLEQPQYRPSNYHLLNYLYLPTPLSDIHQLPYHTSTGFHPHQGRLECAPPELMKYNNWKVEMPSRVQTESSMRITCGHDRMMSTVDIGPTSHCCTRPLRTLELFPLTATNLKEESKNSSSKHLSFHTPTN
ncbi:hypothetical protein K2173_023534 [Erythroxylum novogranatense]|uniref:Homeobox domain-containing protein n=1 Tax=Erythroxylum novogranatense TaxID=1862640 RepID=A0AAV8TRM8_9ROSI|nr:hypothetical protein K2173_023534 [Erythroxylum novogranatense]